MRRFLKTIFLCVTVVLPLVAVAQMRVPDDEDIAKRTIDASSEYYYPSLMTRYIEGDTTLTADDYYYLYYGYAFDANYRPLENIPPEDEVLEVMKGIKGGVATHQQALRLLEAAKDVMLIDPFSPSNINIMTYAYGLLGDTLNERVSADRFNKILGTITSSGTGLKENSPWHILRYSHANDLLGSRGLKIAQRGVRSSKVEYIQLQPNDDKIKGYYFNFERMYWKRPEMLPAREKSNWMINGIPVNK